MLAHEGKMAPTDLKMATGLDPVISLVPLTPEAEPYRVALVVLEPENYAEAAVAAVRGSA